mgnify:CR=1 FL=1
MAIDESKLLFSSQWEVDTITTLQPTVTTVSANTDTLVHSFTGDIPVYEVVAISNGRLYRPGRNGQALGPKLTFHSWVAGNGIYVRLDQSATVRCYAWSDKITY